MSDTPLSELWPRQFRNELIARRSHAQLSLDTITRTDGTYAEAHRIMLRIYDAAITATESAAVSEGGTE